MKKAEDSSDYEQTQMQDERYKMYAKNTLAKSGVRVDMDENQDESSFRKHSGSDQLHEKREQEEL